ncbi:MAG: ATP-binding cassette domain-containing protein [Patescibacteria group bacterium]
MNSSGEIISVQNFSKSFGDNKVVKDLSFEVNKGEIFAFLGANGSGKTTTIRCLLNILQSTSGELTIYGKKYGPKMTSLLGYLPEERGLYTTATVLETMVYFGDLKGLNASAARDWSYQYLEKVGLGGRAKDQVKKLSSGQQQKIQLGITIINQPKLLVLDEPTKGLDPVNRALLMESLEQLNSQGSTIVFITHQMDEVEKLADRLLMIKDGEKVLYGEVNKVKAQFGENIIHLGFKGQLPDNKKLYNIRSQETNYAELEPQGSIGTKQILEYLLKQKLEINKYEIAAPSLQEIFVTISQNNE